MQLGIPGRPHLTYCTNIHSGESLAEVRRAIVEHVIRVKERVARHAGDARYEAGKPAAHAVGMPERGFGVGLRLSALSAEELSLPPALASFRDLLDEHGLYVFTVNGFPYGSFHGGRVKESVYRPDWTEEERLRYSENLSTILAALLPSGVSGSISTVPGAFRDRGVGHAGVIADRLLRYVATLHRLYERTGKLIELALEPEPACLLETTAEAVEFFERHLLDGRASKRVSDLSGLSTGDAAAAIRRHLGLCFDACHLAVEFESPTESVGRLRAAGIRIGKIQVTTAPVVELEGSSSDGKKLEALQAFADSVYLHQVVVRTGGPGLLRFTDLPEALKWASGRAPSPSEWRIHFHVPVYEAAPGAFGSTQPFLRELLSLARREAITEHLEVETYTWDVLPPELRAVPVHEAIARELAWTLGELGVSP